MTDLQIMINTLPQVGKIEWIGIRPERKVPVQEVESVELSLEKGLLGDHYSKNGGNRQVTLLQAEHLQAMANMLNIESVSPTLTRRNILVSGINLLAFHDREFQIGDVILKMTGICHPCTKIEQNLGPGAYNAMRGHGGITAKVVKGGTIRVGDEVRLCQEASNKPQEAS